MLVLTAENLQQTSSPAFLRRLHDFLLHAARSQAFRKVLSDASGTRSFWQPLWPQAQSMTEHDAALFLCFMLVACKVEGWSSADALAATFALPDDIPTEASGLPEIRLKQFLAEHGHLRFSAFDFPEFAAGHAGPAGLTS